MLNKSVQLLLKLPNVRIEMNSFKYDQQSPNVTDLILTELFSN